MGVNAGNDAQLAPISHINSILQNVAAGRSRSISPDAAQRHVIRNNPIDQRCFPCSEVNGCTTADWPRVAAEGPDSTAEIIKLSARRVKLQSARCPRVAPAWLAGLVLVPANDLSPSRQNAPLPPRQHSMSPKAEPFGWIKMRPPAKKGRFDLDLLLETLEVDASGSETTEVPT